MVQDKYNTQAAKKDNGSCEAASSSSSKAALFTRRVTNALDSVESVMSRLTYDLIGECTPEATPMPMLGDDILSILNNGGECLESRLAFMEQQLVAIRQQLLG
jgi:hypothetical protein